MLLCFKTNYFGGFCMNRILSIMLAVCMLAGCAPLALAREITPAVNTIYAIDIWDIDYPPIAGERAGDHRAVSTAANVHFPAMPSCGTTGMKTA